MLQTADSFYVNKLVLASFVFVGFCVITGKKKIIRISRFEISPEIPKTSTVSSEIYTTHFVI